MELTTAKTAGFCFGVTRAVDLCLDTAKKYHGCRTIGPIIHNSNVVEWLRDQGAVPVNSLEELKPENVAVIRSHGITADDRNRLDAIGCRIVDATCPFVSRIHDIVGRESQEGRLVLIIGEEEHPEVQGIASRCSPCLVAENPEKMLTVLNREGISREDPISLVSQTTGNKKNYEKCGEILNSLFTNAKIFDTICLTTSMRQKEAAELSSVSDAMIVIGGRGSANTLRLADICRQYCSRVFMVESAQELDLTKFSPTDRVGVTAGASTPSWIIKEVNQTMSEEIKETIAEVAAEAVEAAAETESFEELVEKSIKTLHNGEKVIGIVAAITPTEVTVDLGTKHAGYIPVSELSADPNAKAEDIVKVGDEV
ncbi:MAG: 4-hydroxy-3-methylbut-2-enyl diphosphate reductase, partial [Oscillospiraceae bacterium]|nr:4-hydroxy-3-methylbut-2-enyl diphosphate reductase [Oscillospiraceae bacterium]